MQIFRTCVLEGNLKECIDSPHLMWLSSLIGFMVPFIDMVVKFGWLLKWMKNLFFICTLWKSHHHYSNAFFCESSWFHFFESWCWWGCWLCWGERKLIKFCADQFSYIFLVWWFLWLHNFFKLYVYKVQHCLIFVLKWKVDWMWCVLPWLKFCLIFCSY